LLHVLLKIPCRQRSAEIIALHFEAIMGVQKIKLFLRFNPLCDNLQVKAPCHADYGADDGGVILIFDDILNK